MKKFLTAIFALCVFTLCVFTALPADSKVINVANIAIYYDDLADIPDIFGGIDLAMLWFEAVRKQAGIPLSHHDIRTSYLNIVVTKMDKNHFGYFDKRFIFIRSKKDDMKYFGLSTRDEPGLYMSLVSHEVAHALLYQHIDVVDNFGFTLKTHPGSEYAAYVCLLAMSGRKLRDRILENYKDKSPITEREIHYFLYELSPEIFGIRCWLHYQKDKAVLHKILKGEFEAHHPGWVKRLMKEGKK